MQAAEERKRLSSPDSSPPTDLEKDMDEGPVRIPGPRLKAGWRPVKKVIRR